MDNCRDTPPFSTLLEQRLSRRHLLKGSAAAAVAGLFSSAATTGLATALTTPAQRARKAQQQGPVLGFDAVPAIRSDTVTVPHGYRVQTLVPWGTPITGDYPPYRPDGTNSGAEQEQQSGSHHDGMHYFPMADNPNGHGLLCINHEYVDGYNLHAGGAITTQPRPTDQVRKEIAAHGVSVVEVKKNPDDGQWQLIKGRYNRRITAATPMTLAGPVRGSQWVATRYSPDGTAARGTINNCANGHTPWGTYLTCEENWAGYFINRDDPPREHQRYGIGGDKSWHDWHSAASGEDEYIRFDATATGRNAQEDYRNEPNTQGWVVEIDPFDPDSVPVKRTALGRFAHEGALLAPPVEGKPLVYYSGDDSRHEYIYKFVTRDPYTATADGSLLDHGTLYAARFDADGSGVWLPLAFDAPAFQTACRAKNVTFQDQAEVLVNTRLAADIMGATPMDRPEWGAVDPHSREVYMSLTNNTERFSSTTDAANPRGPNPYGHIIRWQERAADSSGRQFDWEIFVLSGPAGDGQVLPEHNGPTLTADSSHACPDGLWIDPATGILWIQTDMSGSQQLSGPFGANQVLAANPVSGEIRRFLVGPNDQETTGLTTTPDGRTLFVNIQHPGDRSSAELGFTSNWPDSGAVYRHPGDDVVVAEPGGARPRSATLVVSRTDGGLIGL